ncbi:ArsR/SmtB family transcription factor [Aneurinibacillus aneurinilyticus]|uniref:ArsR/SmtB family transcription factor n=1 Tax=Aneurinibacillus aneurinilyticus TaxID=1391 RepID=UPI003524FE4C
MSAITPQTTSFHLSKLIEGNLVHVEKHGRHRYYRLANEEVARSLKQFNQVKLLREARTCYDHLSGKLGVDLTESILNACYLEKEEREFP